MGLDTFKILLDQPSEHPALGFTEYATALTEIIEHSDPRFAIGIFGGWGSGKTTLMQAIAGGLNKQNAITVQFSAWRYEKEEHLIVPLLDTVREALLTWAEKQTPKIAETARKTAATVGKVITSILAGISFQIGVSDALSLSFEANKALEKAEAFDGKTANEKVARSFYFASFQALNKAFEEFGNENPLRRIVVFVDDLDRCLPDGALDVLESMKLFFDIPGFVFVVGLDQAVIEWSIEAKYGAKVSKESPQDGERVGFQVRGADYIKKIFQVPFTLAPVSITQIEQYVNSICIEANLSPEQLADILQTVLPHLRYIVGTAGVNPREVKRYINAYTLLLKIKPNLDRHVVLALQTIAFQPDWQAVQRTLLVYREVFIDALKSYILAGAKDALEVLDSTLLGVLPGRFEDYLSAGSPGNAFLNVMNIDEYIFSGESTRSSQNPLLIDIMRDIGKLKPSVRALVSLSRIDVDRAKVLAGEANNLRSRLSSLNLPRAANAASDALEVLSLNLSDQASLSAKEPDGVRNWQAEQERLLQQALSRLLDYYQFASF